MLEEVAVTTRSYAFGLSMLNRALEAIDEAYTWHEGLYRAYVEDLQWLEGFEDLPPSVRSSMDGIVEDLTRQPGLCRVERVRATVATLNEERARAIVVRLILLRRAMIRETDANVIPLFPRIPSHDGGPRGRRRVLEFAEHRH